MRKNISFYTHLEDGTFHDNLRFKDHLLGQVYRTICRATRAATMKRKCNASANPTRTLPHCGGSGRVLDAREGGGGGLIFCYYTQGPGICLAPGQPCGRDFNPACGIGLHLW